MSSNLTENFDIIIFKIQDWLIDWLILMLSTRQGLFYV